MKNTKIRRNLSSFIIIALCLVILVMVNLIAGILAQRYGLRADITESGAFTLSRASEEFLDALDKDVRITVLNTEEYYLAAGKYFVQAVEIMHSYARRSDYVELRFVDIMKNPALSSQYPDLDLTSADIIVESGENIRQLTAYDLFDAQVDYAANRAVIHASRAEQALSSAMLAVTDDNSARIALLQGHQEADASAFAELLQVNGYEVVQVDLRREEIDADIAILCGPQLDISEEEARKLDAFLHNDGLLGHHLLVMGSIESDALPVLDAFLAEWGVRMESGVIYETDATKLFQANHFMTLADYAEENYAAEFIEKDMPFAMALARPMEVLFENKNGVQTQSLLEFSVGAGALTDFDTATEDIDFIASGPYPAMVLSVKRTSADSMVRMGGVVTAASDFILNDIMLETDNIANSAYMLNLLDKLAGREAVVHIQNKSLGAANLGISYATATKIMVCTLIVLPLLVLLAGIIVWARRRHR